MTNKNVLLAALAAAAITSGSAAAALPTSHKQGIDTSGASSPAGIQTADVGDHRWFVGLLDSLGQLPSVSNNGPLSSPGSISSVRNRAVVDTPNRGSSRNSRASIY
jgi:hypothetical protein